MCVLLSFPSLLCSRVAVPLRVVADDEQLEWDRQRCATPAEPPPWRRPSPSLCARTRCPSITSAQLAYTSTQSHLHITSHTYAHSDSARHECRSASRSRSQQQQRSRSRLVVARRPDHDGRRGGRGQRRRRGKQQRCVQQHWMHSTHHTRIHTATTDTPFAVNCRCRCRCRRCAAATTSSSPRMRPCRSSRQTRTTA